MNIYPVQKVRGGINVSPYPLYAPQKVNWIFTQTTLLKVEKNNNCCKNEHMKFIPFYNNIEWNQSIAIRIHSKKNYWQMVLTFAKVVWTFGNTFVQCID
jgi:hypothetical protein